MCSLAMSEVLRRLDQSGDDVSDLEAGEDTALVADRSHNAGHGEKIHVLMNIPLTAGPPQKTRHPWDVYYQLPDAASPYAMPMRPC